MVILYIIWIFYEFKVSLNDVSQSSKSVDFGTREFYAIGQAVTILSALWFCPIYARHGIYFVIGIIIFVSGVCFRLWAINTLGKYYSHIVRKADNHKIVETGPYCFLRHPAYAGMIIANTGVVIGFFNYVTLFLFLFILIPAIVLRIYIEEKTLFNIAGYFEYAQNHRRLIPLIW